MYNGPIFQHPHFSLFTLHMIFSLFHLIIQHTFNFYSLVTTMALFNKIQHPTPTLLFSCIPPIGRALDPMELESLVSLSWALLDPQLPEPVLSPT
jgi:hypothetical protein